MGESYGRKRPEIQAAAVHTGRSVRRNSEGTFSFAHATRRKGDDLGVQRKFQKTTTSIIY
jgi:hypothetical protein